MTKLNFNRKPMPIYAEHRPLYKISQLLMGLHISSIGGKSSVLKLQLFNWALKEEHRMKLIENAAQTGELNVKVWGIDPTLNAALQFALAEKLIEQKSSIIKITEKGREYVKKILETNALPEEFSFYSKINKKITEKMIITITETWG